MDNDYLSHLLKGLTITEMSIKETANYCTSNYTSADEISMMITESLLNSRKDRKILYLYLIHEIFTESKLKHKN